MIFLNKYIKYLISFLIIISLSGCNLFKKSIKNNENKNEKKINKISEKVNLNTLNYNTFSTTFSGNYKDDKNQFPLKGILKIKKDSFIWITLRPFLGIEVARILLTPEKINYIDKLKKQYFSENYTYFKKKFGIKIDYKTAEALFSDKIVTFSNKKLSDYKFNKTENGFNFEIQNKINQQIFVHTLFISNNFLLKQNKLFSKDLSKSIFVNYDKFTEINTQKFPLEITIDTKNKNSKGQIIINYKNIKTNNTIKAKFVIPKNYKKVSFD